MPYKVEVLPVGESAWCGNGLRFDTEQAAHDYGRDLLARWTGASAYRVVQAVAEIQIPDEE